MLANISSPGNEFCRASVLEVVAHTRLKDTLIARHTMMGIKNVPDFDVFGNGLRKVDTQWPRPVKIYKTKKWWLDV